MSLDAMLLFGAVVLIAAVGAARLGSRLGLPSLLLFLALGLSLELVGIRMTDAALAHALGFAALVFILAEGGFSTKWVDIKGSLTIAGLLATVGVVVSIALVAAFCHLVVGLPLPQSVLVGAITAPTDSAAIFSVLRGMPLPARVRSVLEGESGLNDAPIVLLVGAATAWTLGDLPGGPLALGMTVALELVGGVALGALIGFAGGRLLRSVALPASGLYPLAALAVAVLAYGLGVWLHLSGFAAVYVAALILGNSQLPHRNATRSFAEGIGWIAQIGLFVMLGMLAAPERLTPQMVVESLLIGGFLTFVARPVSVVLCSVWFKVPWREQAFTSWAGLRGAVPIMLATIPLTQNLPNANHIFNVTFLLVVTFTLLQGPTLPRFARWMGVTEAISQHAVTFDSSPLEGIDASLVQVGVPPGSRIAGMYADDLRLPRGAVLSMVIRGDEVLVPDRSTRLHEDDQLLLAVRTDLVERTQRRLELLHEGGALARWVTSGRNRRRLTDDA